MRLFTGISVEEDALPGLAALQASAKLKWTPGPNLHITTKFIGEWPETRLEALKAALGEVPWAGRLSLEVMELDVLSGVLIAEVKPEPALLALQRATEDAVERLGCSRETRPYRPHITLARMEARDARRVRETIASMWNAPVCFEADSFHLYQSKSGSHYTKLATYR